MSLCNVSLVAMSVPESTSYKKLCSKQKDATRQFRELNND